MASGEGITSTPHTRLFMPGTVPDYNLINTRDIFVDSPTRRGHLGDRRATRQLRKSFIERLNNDSFTDHAQMIHGDQVRADSVQDTGPDIVTISGVDHTEYTLGDTDESREATLATARLDLSRQLMENQRAIQEMEAAIRGSRHFNAYEKSERVPKRHFVKTKLSQGVNTWGEAPVNPANRPKDVFPVEKNIPSKTYVHPVSTDMDIDNNITIPKTAGTCPDATNSDMLDIEQQLDVLRYRLDSMRAPSHLSSKLDQCRSMIDDLARQAQGENPPSYPIGGGDTFGQVTTPVPKLQKPIAMPESFTGSRSENFTDWVKDFELYAELNSWGEEQKFKFLPICLKDGARRVFSDLTGVTNYANAISSLRERFDPQCYAEVHKLNLRRRKRNKNESFFDLALDLRKLAKQAFPKKDQEYLEDLVKEQFIEAVHSRELRLRLRRAKLSLLDEMVAFSVEHETYELLENARGKDNLPVHATDSNPNITCHKCREKGHVARVCPKPGKKSVSPKQETFKGSCSSPYTMPEIDWRFLQFPPPPVMPGVQQSGTPEMSAQNTGKHLNR